MSRVMFLEDRCKGCLLCTLACPVKIIKQADRINQQGYKVVEVTGEDMASCTGCAFCALTCPDFAIKVWKSPKFKTSNDSKAEG